MNRRTDRDVLSGRRGFGLLEIIFCGGIFLLLVAILLPALLRACETIGSRHSLG